MLLAPNAEQSFQQIATEPPHSVTLLIGAEGGLTEGEILQAIQVGYQCVRLGTRILRTETAAITMLSISQFLWGDLGV